MKKWNLSSPVFIKTKSEWGVLLIQNLKRLNELFKHEKYKMVCITAILKMIIKNCYMETVDLKYAYHSVRMS